MIIDIAIICLKSINYQFGHLGRTAKFILVNCVIFCVWFLHIISYLQSFTIVIIFNYLSTYLLYLYLDVTSTSPQHLGHSAFKSLQFSDH